MYSLRLDTFGSLTNRDLFSQNIIAYIPSPIREFIGDYAPAKKLLHARHTAKLANAVSRQLIDQKSKAYLQGKGNRDILSLLGTPCAVYMDVLIA